MNFYASSGLRYFRITYKCSTVPPHHCVHRLRLGLRESSSGNPPVRDRRLPGDDEDATADGQFREGIKAARRRSIIHTRPRRDNATMNKPALPVLMALVALSAAKNVFLYEVQIPKSSHESCGDACRAISVLQCTNYGLFNSDNGDSRDGGKAPRLTLNDGNSIPTIGLGTFLGFDENGQKDVKPGDVSTPLEWAIEAGYRMVDTASAYKNEEDVGIGIRNAISNGTIRREDMYVVTKLGSTEQRNVVPALRQSLKKLNMDYVDLYLIHSPVTFTPNHSTFDVIDYLDTWKSMEETKKLGLAKSIGLSNFNQSQIQRILDNAEINPSVLQVEVNLNLGQDRLIEYAKDKGIVVMAYTPFGSIFESQDSAAPPPRVDDPQLRSIAERYGKTVPQIVLRYLVQRGLVPIPKSIHKNRIEENIDLFNFELTPEEMKTLAEFNKDYRTVYPSYWQDHPYYPYERKEVPDKSPF
ncbi:Aldo-keto reductase AKR2E4 [Eumeta japonica]|uniref:Aldo-keto reductase AKR2E4 n=1 Tax=Eumeta variegata TaxID=151549 RepID=A0A4C1TWC7_EUMVA|nr:Aldo-keto reductase AKR2E4 [Eumeta japonica]